MNGGLSKLAINRVAELVSDASFQRLARTCVASLTFLMMSFGATIQFVEGQVTVETISSGNLNGRSLSVADGQLTLEGESSLEMALEDVLKISLPAANVPSSETTRVHFVTGGSMALPVVSLDENGVVVMANRTTQTISLEAIAAVSWKPAPGLEEILARPSADSDTFLIEGPEGKPQTVSGMFESMDETKVALQFSGQSRTVDRERVLAIAPARIINPSPAQSRAKVTLSNGDSFSGVLTKLDAEIAVVGLAGSDLQIEASQIVSIELTSDRILRIADLESLQTESRPLFAPDRSLMRNRSIEGNPLQVRVTEGQPPKIFQNGLGSQAGMTISFENPGHNRFRALAGIDSETDGRGDCVVVVKGDGIMLWSKRIQGAGPAVEIDVDVTGMRRIELTVEAGEQLDFSDHVDWIEPRLVSIGN